MLDSSTHSSSVASQRAWLPWLICVSAGLFFFYEFFQLNIFDVINHLLRREFHLNATQLGWMSSTFMWANVFFLLPAGIILDRFSVRRAILIAMLVCILGTFGFALSRTFFWATSFHALTGIGNAFCFLACVILVSRWFPRRRQALVIGCLVTMAFIGGMLAHTPFAYLNAHYGWRNVLVLDGIVGLFLLLWIFIFVEDKPTAVAVKFDTQAWWQDFIRACVNRQNWLTGIYISFLNLPIMVLCALWGASYLKVVQHLSSFAASNIVSFIYIGSIVGCPVVGWLSDLHARRKPVMIMGALMTILLTLPLSLGIELSQTALIVFFFAIGFFSSTQVVGYPLIAESNSLRSTGAATGIASILIMGGGAGAQIVFGLLLQNHAKTATQYITTDFQFAMTMFPIAALIALLAIFLTKETYCRKECSYE